MTLWWLLCSSPFDISTHILTKRMTIFSMASSSALIFQLTSSRRGWLRFDAGNHGAQHFNSHPHEEDDDQGICKKTDCITFQLTSSRRGWHIVYDLKTLIKEFQLTSSRRGWLQMIGYDKDQKHFNSHPHEEDDMAFSRLFLTSFSFQLTSSRRGWHWSGSVEGVWNISTHILTKRMTYTSIFNILIEYYFNSHPHEEDDGILPFLRKTGEGISTHILTKRMTLRTARRYCVVSISTHILTKRMTVRSIRRRTWFLYFNSHPHEEDDTAPPLWRGVFIISTHILTKRMTSAQQTLDQLLRHFNSHPHEEDDYIFIL